MTRMLLIVATCILLLAAGAGCGEIVESHLCRSAASKVCTKWFSCFPVISTGLWLSKGNCEVSMNSWCDDSELWTGCDVDNNTLRVCDNNIDSSPCGSLPPECYDLQKCYSDTK